MPIEMQKKTLPKYSNFIPLIGLIWQKTGKGIALQRTIYRQERKYCLKIDLRVGMGSSINLFHFRIS